MKGEKITRARICAAVDEALPLMRMEHYSLTHIFDTGTPDDGKTAAITEASWQYMHANIRWFLALLQSMTDARLFEAVVHELAHVLLNPLDSQLGDGELPAALNEYATESVTQAILHAAGRSVVNPQKKESLRVIPS